MRKIYRWTHLLVASFVLTFTLSSAISAGSFAQQSATESGQIYLPAIFNGDGVVVPAGVVINEFLPNSANQWVELYNPGAAAVDISYHYIDDVANGGRAPVQIPAHTVVPANGYAVVYVGGSYFNNNGDDVRFLDPHQVELDAVSFTYSTPEYAWYRFPDGGRWSLIDNGEATPGTGNPGLGGEVWQPGAFEIHILNVGQGDSQLIIFPSGYTLLIDVREASWNSNKGARLVAQKIWEIRGDDHINVGVLSHHHLDHIGYAGYGGFWALLERFDYTFDKIIDRDAGAWVDGHGGGAVDGLCDPDLEIVWHNAGAVSGTSRNWLCYATHPANDRIYPLREIAELWSISQIDPPDAEAVVKIVQVDGDGVMMADGITPIQGDRTQLGLPPSENDYSIGLRIRYGQIDYATAGDADGVYAVSGFGYTYNDVETVLAPRFGPVDVMLANHHGSRNSTNQYYVDVLSPTVAAISCGSNSYGHPDQAVLDRLTAVSDVYITGLCDPDRDYSQAEIVGGDIVLRSTDGLNYTVNGVGYTAADPERYTFTVWDFEEQTSAPSLDLTGNAAAGFGGGLAGESFPAGHPDGTSAAAWGFTHWSQTASIDPERYVEFMVDMSDYRSLELTFAERRDSGGPLALAIGYSVDGHTFIPAPGAVVSLPDNTNWRVHSFELSHLNGAIPGRSSVYFRIYGYAAGAETGGWRIDDVVFTAAAAIPPPPAAPEAFTVWDFEDLTSAASLDLTGNAAASSGSALGGESFPAGNPGGTSAAAWSFTHWSQTSGADADRYFEFAVDMSDYENATLAFAERRSATGPLAFEIHYSVNGATFTPIAATATTLPNNTAWRSHTFDLSGLNSQIAGQPFVQFRIYGYNASGATGTWRIDDVTFVGQ